MKCEHSAPFRGKIFLLGRLLSRDAHKNDGVSHMSLFYNGRARGCLRGEN